MNIKAFVEGYAIRSDQSYGRTRVSEWGWRITLADGQPLAHSTATFKTKRAAVAAGKATATGYFEYSTIEVIELTRGQS